MTEMKAMSPKTYLDKQVALKKDSVVEKINEALNNYAADPTYVEWVEVIIEGDYSTTVRNEAAKEFIKSGWKKIYHRTSSENGERAGLTRFVLLTEETVEKWEYLNNRNKYWCVSEADI